MGSARKNSNRTERLIVGSLSPTLGCHKGAAGTAPGTGRQPSVGLKPTISGHREYRQGIRYSASMRLSPGLDVFLAFPSVWPEHSFLVGCSHEVFTTNRSSKNAVQSAERPDAPENAEQPCEQRDVHLVFPRDFGRDLVKYGQHRARMVFCPQSLINLAIINLPKLLFCVVHMCIETLQSI